jgi:hypothetical protein
MFILIFVGTKSVKIVGEMSVILYVPLVYFKSLKCR